MDLYNQKCYKYLCDFILKDTKFKQYLITDNLSIRKTFFGRLMLIMLLKKNKKVLLDYETVMVLIYPSGNTEYVRNKLQYRQIVEEQDVWYIIDKKIKGLNGSWFLQWKVNYGEFTKKSYNWRFWKAVLFMLKASI